MLVHNIVKTAVESEFVGLDPIEFLTFFCSEMKLNQLIFRNRKLDGLLDLLANKIMLKLNKREKTHELVAQKGDKTE
jgi:hypothetical protein